MFIDIAMGSEPLISTYNLVESLMLGIKKLVHPSLSVQEISSPSADFFP